MYFGGEKKSIHKSTVTLVLISFWSLQSIQFVCPDRLNQSLFSSSAIYPKYFPAFTFLVNNSSERSENTSQSSKAPTKTFGVAFGSVSISGPCVDRFDAIFVVRILDRSDQQILGAIRALCQFGSTRSYGPNFGSF